MPNLERARFLVANEKHLARRGTIFLETAPVISQRPYPAGQFVLRVQSPKCAARAKPGTFAHIGCDDSLPMRRPLSIMRVSADEGWVEFLYKTVGQGLSLLAERQPGESVSVLGPIGTGFTPNPDRPRLLAIGGGVGIPPMVFLAETLVGGPIDPVVLMGSEVPFPFESQQSPGSLPGIPPLADGVVPELEALGIPSRLASNAELPHAFLGFVTDLARAYLDSQSEQTLNQTQIATCGPTPMLRAVAALAQEYGMPCQVALEEFMACGVGGCAGCTVLVKQENEFAMKRVCVDGPVFDAAQVFFDGPANRS